MVLDQAEAVAETIEDDISELKRIERTLSRLHHIREGYNGSLGMKRLVKQLSETDVLIGPGCQVDIVSLRNYVKGFGPNILPLACPELQDLHDTICLEATDVLKRSEQQLIAAKATAPVMDPKPTPVPTPRSSTLSLKLPSFHGDLLKWRDFWALFCSRLEKEPGLTDTDKGCLLVEAMADIKARQRAEAALAHTDTFDKAVLALKRHYEDDRLLFIHHFDELTQQDTVKETVEDIDRLEDRLRSSIRGMSMANGYSADQMVVAIAEKTLTPGTVKQWKQYIYEETVPPSTELFFSFLDRQRKSAPDGRLSQLKQSKSKGPVPSKRSVLKLQEAGSTTESRDKCTFCSQTHAIYMCTGFKDLAVPARLEQVRQKKLCFNCLAKNHSASQCPSKKRCKRCQARHHTLLHKDSAPAGESDTSPSSATIPATSSVASATQRPVTPRTACLPRTVLGLASDGGCVIRCRAQLATGAMLSLVTRKLANSVKAKRIKGTAITISGVGGELHSTHEVEFQFQSLDSSDSIMVRASVVDAIPQCVTAGDATNASKMRAFKDLKLADPQYSPGARVDLLLGISHCNMCSLPGVVLSQGKGYKAELTIFGWAVGGSSLESPSDSTSTCLKMAPTQNNVGDLLQRIWALEEVPGDGDRLTYEELQAVSNFRETHTRSEDGRYVVGLPKKDPLVMLGKSRTVALRRYLANERTLKGKKQWESFHGGVQEYLDLHHAERVPDSDMNKQEGVYYLPMHGVIKEESTTTKLRIVFDASARTSSGQSLNDTLLSGPSLYPLLASVITRFRKHPVAISGDISKMFREVGLLQQEKDLHRFLHREVDSGNIADYRMTRLTFGVKSSPYLATQVLRQLADDHRQEFPRAAKLVSTDFYVDDCLTGADSVSEAISVREELNSLLGNARMTLRKWRSNSSELLATVPEELREKTDLNINFSPAEHGKALGLRWNTLKDTLSVSVPPLQPPSLATKRAVCSAIAKTFDVMGWYAPAVLPAKLLLQDLWRLELSWDQELPDYLQLRWRKWAEDLHFISDHTLPRYMGSLNLKARDCTLHGFADASSKAYGGVVYLRTVYHDCSIQVSLVTAKSRVAPLKTQTIPRLELCGALLLTDLLTQVAADLTIPPAAVYAWTDSAVVLGWLRTSSSRLKTFVVHRVTDITSKIPPDRWRYIQTNHNPADLVSRGVLPSVLLENALWWKGPAWLSYPPSTWPKRQDLNPQDLPDIKPSVLMAAPPPEEYGLRFSSYGRMVRVTTWILRFLQRVRLKKVSESAHLTAEELKTTETLLYKVSQKHTYASVLSELQKVGYLPAKHQYASLALFLDDQGLLRVGGRLQKADLPQETKHPVLLSTHSHTVRLLVQHNHILALHAGTSTVMARLSLKYHIPRLKPLLKGLSRKCVTCQKTYARVVQQRMGELPSSRVTPARPFSTIGVDFAGPVTYKEGNVRKPTVKKGYICVYVCFVIKAVHLDLVADMTTEAFLASLRRFSAIYGAPTHIWSDNGSNFTGANREIQQMYNQLQTTASRQQLEYWAHTRNCQWTFSPSRAPHFGGLWEAAVKAMKLLLRKTTKDRTLRVDELQTLLFEAAAVMNSRPLYPIETHSDDGVEPLTPAHFLTGGLLTSLPVDASPSTHYTYSRRWSYLQGLTAGLWKRWKQEYLLLLQKRIRWRTESANLVPGDIVLLKDADLFMRSWPMGRVVDTFPGTDGLVRAVSIKVRGKIFRRPVHKLVKLLGEVSETSPRGEYVQALSKEPGTEQ